ncbi:MAG: hypothetical protein HFI90_06655 [Clostridia bacterium]|nr:hypothetical protein [Clostridia bacterium]
MIYPVSFTQGTSLYDMKEYAEPGVKIALVLESEHPCHITEGVLVTKKQEESE